MITVCSRLLTRHRGNLPAFFAKRISSMSSDQVKVMVDTKIKGKKIMVFSKTYCPFCTKAKAALKNYPDEDIEIMEIENDPNCSAIQDYLQKLTNGRSVPRVFVKGKFIGGGDETAALHKNGELAKMLKD